MLSLLAIARKKPFSVIHFTAKPFASIPQTSPNFMVDYLISSFGFSPDKAATVSKSIAYVKSPEKPDSVRHFLEHNGFTHAQIKTIVTCRPEILCSSPENTLGPNLHALSESGLSSPAVTQIVFSDPTALLLQTAVPRIKFCRDFLGGSEAALVKACMASRSLASLDISPNIALLHSLGLSTHEIQRIILRFDFISNSPASIKNMLNRAKELGFQPGSPLFVCGLRAISSNSREAFQIKMELLKSYGWSDDDFFAALRKSPNIVYLTEKTLQKKMDFLIKEVRCSPSHIASYPGIITFNLERRLRPRHHVLHLLELLGLSSQGQSFYHVIKMTDNKFVENFILPHKEKISGFHEVLSCYLCLRIENGVWGAES